MRYKLLATDLDGTLLDDKSELSEKNREALAMLRDKGVYTLICSGRSPMSLMRFEDMLGIRAPDCYGIGLNGCLVYETDTRRKLRRVLLGRNLFDFILEEVSGFNLEPLVYTENCLYMYRINEVTEPYINMAQVPYKVLESFSSIKDTTLKIMLRGDKKELEKARDYMSNRAPGSFNMFYSSPWLLEFCSPEASKGSALMFLADYLGVLPEETVAVGDNYNDETMLLAAGLGVAVANGEPEIRSIAGYVTKADNNNSALAEVAEVLFH